MFACSAIGVLKQCAMPTDNEIDRAIIAALGVHRAEYRIGRANSPGLTSAELADGMGELVEQVELRLRQLATRERVLPPDVRGQRWAVRRRPD
jgi:hypothetical protein